MPRSARTLLVVLAAFVATASAQDGDLAERVRKLEEALTQERADGQAREERIRELESALRKATEALAHAQDKRGLEGEIETYLRERGPAPGPESGAESRLNIGGVIVTSFRFTDVSGNNPRTSTFNVEERYLRFVYRFTEQVTARYYTDGSLAELEYHHRDWLQVNAGVVVVPFGQFNQRSFPDTFDTLTRPLLYLGDEDTFAQPANNPEPVFRSLYSDTGVVVSGSRWTEGGDQLYYAAFVVNGLVGTTDLAQGSSFSDNNQNKQVGARVTYTVVSWFEQARLGVGASWMTGKYDSANSLSFRMYGADLIYVLEGLFRRGEGSFTIRTEFVFSPQETLHPIVGDPTSFLNDATRTQGAYILFEARIDRQWMVYVQLDWLSQKARPLAAGFVDPTSAKMRTEMFRYAAGVVYKFSFGIVWKTELAYWEFDAGAPDALRFSTQVVIPF